MDLETKLTSQNYDLQEIEMKSNMKDLELPNFGVPNSSSSQGNTNFLQELLHIDPFQPSGSSQNPIFGVQNPNFQTPFEYFTYGCSSADFDGYESKPFVGNNVVKGQSKVMDNFQYGGSDNYSNTLNLPQRNINHHQIMEMMDSNQSQYYVPFDPQETKPVMNFVVPDDEVSCISPDHSFCRRVGLNSKNNRTSSPTTRTCKVRNKSNVVKGQWTVEEDRLLIQLVEQYGVKKWSHIARSLPGRIGKQCRERWYNHLRPDIKKDTWSNEEDKILIEAHAEIGNKWAEIAKKLPGRTENSIKNHWNATKRRQYSKRKCRSKYPRPSLLQEYIKSLNLDKNPPIDYRKRSSFSANNNPIPMTTSTRKGTAASRSSGQFCPDHDRLVPICDFKEDPDFCFDESLNLFEEGCNIETLLDDMPCGGDDVVVSKAYEGDVQVKKEMDLVEMMSQVNKVIV